MDSKRVRNLAISFTFLLLLVGLASSDINQDKAECAEKLVGLAKCLPYVSGQAKAPAIDCCTGLKEVLDKSKKCLCVLIKDRDDPNLGLKINVTLALQLPSACHTPTNITECIDLLHLAPNSPEAQVYKGFQKATQSNSSTPVPSASSTGAQDKGSGGWGERRLVEEMVCGIILPFIFISQFFFFLV